MNAAFMRLDDMNAAFMSYEGIAGRDHVVTGVHERLCGTTGTTAARRVRPFTIKIKLSGIALEQRKCGIHVVRA